MPSFILHQNEKLIKVYRQPELSLAKTVLVIFIALYIPWFFILKYGFIVQARKILLFWTILVFLYGVYKYLLWQLNTYLLTDQRLMAIRYRTLFHKEILETPLERIANISTETKGFLPTILSYGTIHVRMTALNETLDIENIKNPQIIKAEIIAEKAKITKPPTILEVD